MNNHLDEAAIAQIKDNVHKKQVDIYIPCLRTYHDLLGMTDAPCFDATEVFFEFAAYHKSRSQELKQRKDPVRVFRTSPIADALLEIADDAYANTQNASIMRAVNL